MSNGEYKESFLAGDLQDRVKRGATNIRVPLLTVQHAGELEQLEKVWGFIQSQSRAPSASAVLEYLRSVELDINYRENDGPIAPKNAGNFYKRVTEFGQRRSVDASYLKQQ